MITVDELFRLFDVNQNKLLAVELGTSEQNVSNWKRTGVPAIVERKAIEMLRERGIVSEQQPPEYSGDVVVIPKGTPKEYIETFMKLPRSSQAMMGSVFEQMLGLPEQEQWKLITERLGNKKEGE